MAHGKPGGKTGRSLSRRNFLQATACMGAAAIGMPRLARQDEGPERPTPFDPDSVNSNVESVLSIPRTEWSMPGRYPGVVAEVYHPKAVEGQKPHAEVAAAMLAAGMKALTGDADQRDAWARFFTPKDRIGIKINPIAGKLLCNTHGLIRSIIANLESIGVPRGNIVLWDRREHQMDDTGYTAQNYPGVKVIGTEYKVTEGDEEVWKGEDRLDKGLFYEFDIVGEYGEELMPYMINGGSKSYFTSILTEMVDKVINVPVLKNAGPSVTLCLKNMAFGSTSNTFRGHKIWNRYISEVCSFPVIRDKTVLNVVDGLRGCFEGGPGAVARYIWNAKMVWVATDPVAADAVGWDFIFDKRVAEGIAQPEEKEGLLKKYDKLARAEKLGLGNCDRGKIDHRRIELA